MLPGSHLSSEAEVAAHSSGLEPGEIQETCTNSPRHYTSVKKCNDEEVADVRSGDRLGDQTATQSMVELTPQAAKQQNEIQFQHYVPGEEEDAQFMIGNVPRAERARLDPFRYSDALNPFKEDQTFSMDEFELDWTPNCVFDKNRLQVYRYRCLSSDGTETIKYLTIGQWSGRMMEAPVPNNFWKKRDVSLLLITVSMA
ncbi:hypothetical protein N0V82_008217 [Gnomoniopsis sp. IMI 355080]|nr:hypothetical protein N0V82_008217 [Gnomoniopsis sp. IMI 355080]